MFEYLSTPDDQSVSQLHQALLKKLMGLKVEIQMLSSDMQKSST